MVTKELQMLQMPLVTLYDHVDSIRASGKGAAEFSGMKVTTKLQHITCIQSKSLISSGLKEYLTFATTVDSGAAVPQGYHGKNAVSIWPRGGRKMVDPSAYMTCMEILKPDILQFLADGDTAADSTNKRVTKSVDSTLHFAELCAAFRQNSEVNVILTVCPIVDR